MVESLAPVVDINILIATLGLFFVAALMEIGGGYLVWQWIREKKGILIGLIGGIILFLYGYNSYASTISFWKNICRIWRNIHYFVNCMGNDCR
jgi:hypothetical protein